MNNNICALNKNQTTCLPEKSIKNIASNFINNTNKSSDKIIDELSKKNEKCEDLDNVQHKELCILQNIQKDNSTNKNINKLVSKHIIQYFKPVANKLDGNYWINNTEIDNIQHQLLKNFPNYYYSYIHMFDLKMFPPQTSNLFEEHNKILPITKIDFVNELKNKTNMDYNKDLNYYGIVCNTDISSGGGIHWFCIFIDFTKNPIEIEYFNSSGYDIKNDFYGNKFKKFFINLADNISLNYKPCIFKKVTDIEHQRSDTANCGSYSLYYIWKRLTKNDYSSFVNKPIEDEDMEKFRSFLWRKKNELKF